MVRHAHEAYRDAVAHIQAGRWQEAAQLLETWAPRHPHPALWALLGAARHRLGDLPRAREALRTSLELAPQQADTHHNLAVVLRDLGDLEDALHHSRQAQRLRPRYPAAVRLEAELLQRLGRLDEAVAVLQAQLRAHPDDAAAWNNLGLVEQQRGRLEAAAGCLERALTLADDPETRANLGLVHLHQGRLEQAWRHLQAALARAPQHPDLHNHLGLLAERRGHPEAALAHYRDALALDPHHPQAHNNLALVALGLGRLDLGWRHYRWRRSRRRRQPLAALPHPLAGRTLHIERDQGLGDELFFLRWVPALRQAGARIHYHGDPRLLPLLARSALCDALDAAPAQATETFSVGDLPALVAPEAHPPPIPLRPEPAALETARARLAQAPGDPAAPLLALTWRAGTPGPNRLDKRIDPACLGQALRPLPHRVVILQRRPAAEELRRLREALGRPVLDLSEANEDLEAILALLALVDHYLTVPNTNVHLRAGLGRTSLVLVPHPPEWRWGWRGETSPWFPGHAVLRQGQNGRWETALAQAVAYLVTASPL